MDTEIDLTYPKILSYFSSYLVPERTESHAFLAWFLENFYRLDEIDVLDSIVDGKDDKGIDAIYIDENLESVDVFQAKLAQNLSKTLGDTDLKEFWGTLSQMRSPESLQAIADSTNNTELKNLILENKLTDLIAQGYSVRGVFVTNRRQDANARSFLDICPDITLFDRQTLEESYVSPSSNETMNHPVTLDVSEGFIEYKTADAQAVIASIKASDLLAMEGIDSGKLFNGNLRQTLGKTKVNKEIARSVEALSEHKDFMLYHNGVTVLCNDMEIDAERIKINNYNVVNGCQSITTLHQKSNKVSDELRIITRIVKIASESSLAAKITNRTNNQNSIKARDFQSNSSLQRRLKSEFETQYAGQIFYRIKRGESSDLPVIIDNDVAARLLLSFDLEQPWVSHQINRILEEMHAAIFGRPEVNAKRIVALSEIHQIVLSKRSDISDNLMAGYTLSQYFLVYLLKLALEADDQGKEFCTCPEVFLEAPNGLERLHQCVSSMLDDLIVDLNAELKERRDSGKPFDYKRELKNAGNTRKLAQSVLSPFLKAVNRNRVPSFSEQWTDSYPD